MAYVPVVLSVSAKFSNDPVGKNTILKTELEMLGIMVASGSSFWISPLAILVSAVRREGGGGGGYLCLVKSTKIK